MTCPVPRPPDRVPYEELSPQDQVDWIVWSEGVTFERALDLWAERHGYADDRPQRSLADDGWRWPQTNRDEWA